MGRVHTQRSRRPIGAARFRVGSRPWRKQQSFVVNFEALFIAARIFGGGGVSKEFPIEKLFRDARAAMIEDGSNDTLSITGGTMLLNKWAWRRVAEMDNVYVIGVGMIRFNKYPDKTVTEMKEEEFWSFS